MEKNIHFHTTHEQLSQEVAAHILSRINESKQFHIGLATGHSPQLTYQIIARALEENPILIPRIQLFQLDEWLGLDGTNPSSCRYYLIEQVIRPWNLKPEQYFLLNGKAENMDLQLKEMRDHLNNTPLDSCILGLGKNGHLAFNEPGSRLEDSSRIVTLEHSSRSHDMLGGLKTTLDKGITIGLREIINSGELLLIVSGAGKEEARRQLLNNAPIDQFPGSAVYQHPNYRIYIA